MSRAPTLPERIGRALRLLVAVGAGLLGVGLLFAGDDSSPRRLTEAIVDGPFAERLLGLGLALVLVGPIAGLVLAGREFVRRGDRRMAAVLALELALFVAGVALGLRQ